MYFDPGIFELLRDSIAQFPNKPKLALANSFTLYMLLQSHAKGKRHEEQNITIDILRPNFSPTNDRRKDEDIMYFFQILQNANLITFEIKMCNICYTIIKYTSAKTITYEKSESLGKPCYFVLIKECNRHIIEENPKNNVPFALYCLLKSLKRKNEGSTESIRIAFNGMKERLDICFDTLDKAKRRLEEDGYLFTFRGYNYDKDKPRATCNEYILFDYDSETPKRKSKYKIQESRKPLKRKADKVKQTEQIEEEVATSTPSDEPFDFDV